MKLAVFWALISIADLLLLATLGNTILHVEHLPASARMLLVFREMLTLAAMIVIVVGPFLFFEYIHNSKSSNRHNFMSAVSLSVCWVLLFLFISSWIQFHSTGRFLDSDSLLFFFSNPVQMLQHFSHMEPMLALAVPVVLLGSIVVLIFIFIRLNGARPAVSTRISAYSLVLILALALGSLGIPSPEIESRGAINDPGAGKVYTFRDLYWECKGERSGPAAHVLSQIASGIFDTEEDLKASPEIGIEWKPLLPMEEYLKRIDWDRAQRWNVIIVIVESLRTDQLRAGGSPVVVMPNVERLAQAGHAHIGNYSQASHSNYADLCPLSSHYPLRSSRTHIYPEQPTYPRVMIYDILKAVGYRTAIISSQDENWGKMINYLNTGNVDHFFHAANYSGPLTVPHGDTGFESWMKGAKPSGKIDDRYTVSESIRWSDTLQKDPFFIYLNLQKSHVPYETPADFPRRFGVETLPCNLRFNQFPVECTPFVKEAYANSLAYVDYQLGRLIEALKSRGQWDRTIMIVTGDTGQAFYEHGFAAHANKLYDEVVRVPIVLYAPGLESRIETGLVEHVDIPPTILELLGLPPHPSFQGKSLLDAGSSISRSAYLVVQAPLAHQYAIVHNGLKYIYDAQSRRSFAFDLSKDPEERFNLMDNNSGSFEELHRRLNTWRKLQIDYYSSLQQHRKWYPPVLKD